MSDRQVRRLLTVWLEHGPTVLVHGNRGRRPVNRTGEDLRTRIVALVPDRYRDVDRAHLAELLNEHEGISIPGRPGRDGGRGAAAEGPVNTLPPGISVALNVGSVWTGPRPAPGSLEGASRSSTAACCTSD